MFITNPEIQTFIGSEEYFKHKALRIKGADGEIPLKEHLALILKDTANRKSFTEHYKSTSNLYYKGQPDFDLILSTIKTHIDRF